MYLIGFAIGTFFWGKFSDKYGRKPVLLVGLGIYVLGCIGCFYAGSLSALMMSRFIQAFGGSTGSVLGQVICRDAFNGSDRGKVFSIIGSALAFSPVIGPVIGGLIAQLWQWTAVFALLSIVGLLVMVFTILQLPETYTPVPFSFKTIQKTVYCMMKDPKVLIAGFLVAACNGISFSYFAEGPFYLITLLGLSPFLYGTSFILFALAGMWGSYASKKWHDQNLSAYIIMQKGTDLVLFGATLFIIGVLLLTAMAVPAIFIILLTVATMACIMAGIGMIIPNILSLALEDYRATLGTASSFFGFYYYSLISLFTLVMGFMHNETLFPMPLFFMAIALSMYGATKYITRIRYMI
jgi:DHA1 family bicyclomycin/chloramphenicol resistance-like MFS transporter